MAAVDADLEQHPAAGAGPDRGSGASRKEGRREPRRLRIGVFGPAVIGAVAAALFVGVVAGLRAERWRGIVAGRPDPPGRDRFLDDRSRCRHG